MVTKSALEALGKPATFTKGPGTEPEALEAMRAELEALLSSHSLAITGMGSPSFSSSVAAIGGANESTSARHLAAASIVDAPEGALRTLPMYAPFTTRTCFPGVFAGTMIS